MKEVMQIVVKATKDLDKDPIEIITRNVVETLGGWDHRARVSKVFSRADQREPGAALHGPPSG
jgi:hypothetical protein